MTDNKQYPELPEPTAWRTYDNLLKRARYNAVPITSMQPGIYSHTQMFTEDQMYAYVDADRAMRAAQAAPASQDANKFDLGQRVHKIRGSRWQGRVVGTYSTSLTPEGYAVESETEHGSVQIYPAGALELCTIDAARAKQEGK